MNDIRKARLLDLLVYVVTMPLVLVVALAVGVEFSLGLVIVATLTAVVASRVTLQLLRRRGASHT